MVPSVLAPVRHSFRLIFVFWLVAACLASRPVGADPVVSGTVVDPDGRAVVEATVTFERAGVLVASTSTDAAGRFAVETLASGSYVVKVAFPGLSLDPQFLVLGEDATSDALELRTRLSAISDSIVVSAGASEELVSTTPVSTTVFSAQDIESRQAGSIGDLLRATAGVTVSQSGGSGGLTAVFPRGGESNYSLVLVDGVRVNDMGGGFDFALLPMSGIERVEIVRGPQSAVFGADAIGGVVQVVTRRGGPWQFDALAEGGSQSSRRFDATVSGSRGLWSGGADVGRRASDGFNGHLTSRGERVSNDAGHQTAAGGRLSLGTANWRVGGQGRIVRSDKGYPGPFGSDPNGTYSGVDSVSRGRTTHGAMALSAETKLSTRLRARGFWSYARLLGDFDSPFGPSSNDTIRHNARGLMDVLLAPRWSATAGTELLFERGESSFVTNRNGDMLPIRRRVVGTFVETRGDLGNRASITAGLRVEHIQRASLEADAFGQRPALDTASHVSLNPRLGVSWLAYRSGSGGSSTRVRASAGTGIRPPDVFELAFTDNPDLAAERSRSYEAGAEQTLAGGRLVAEVTWFSNEYDDLIVAVAPAFQDASRYLTDNIANARARGLEVSGSLRPGRHVTIRSAYTWLDTEILAVDGRSGAAPAPFTAGDPLIRRPRHQGWLEVISTTERIETFARFGARGRVLDIDPSFGAFGGRLRGPGYAVLDAGASVTLFKGLSLFGRMTNALDRSYEEALGFPSPGRLLMGGVRVAARR